MKNLIWSAILLTVLTACNKKTEEVSTTVATTDTITEQDAPAVQEQVYTCAMHPEVVGKKGDKCPKCEMDLTVEVAP